MRRCALLAALVSVAACQATSFDVVLDGLGAANCIGTFAIRAQGGDGGGTGGAAPASGGGGGGGGAVRIGCGMGAPTTTLSPAEGIGGAGSSAPDSGANGEVGAVVFSF